MYSLEPWYCRIYKVILALAFILFSHSAMAETHEIRHAPSVLPSEIVGTVVLNGCEINLEQVRLRAVPLGVSTSDGVDYIPDPRASTQMAEPAPTGDPHVVRFSIKGLMPATMYQLGIAYPPNPCGKIFWRGPERGLVISGGAPVLLEGYAATTEIEVLRYDSGGAEEWVGTDDLQFDDADASKRIFRWRTALQNVNSGELQIATEPFPTRGNFSACEEPESGVIHRQILEVRGNPGEFQETGDIDFNAIIGGRDTRTDDEIGISATDGSIDGTPISAGTLRMLKLGAPVYLRVVPITPDGPVCDARQGGVPGWTVMAKIPGDFQVPPDPVDIPKIQPWYGQTYTPPYLGTPIEGHPTYGELAYKVIKPHKLPTAGEISAAKVQLFNPLLFTDPLGYYLVESGLAPAGTTLLPGTWFVFTPSKSSSSSGGNFISDFGSALSGLGAAFGGLVTATVNFAGEFVDYMHHLTEQIKNSLTKAVVDIATVVPGVGPACGALESVTGNSCEDVVKAGMTYGLTSMGVPPTLPSWNELKEQGVEYLASQVASEIGDPTGLTQKLTEEQINNMVNKTLEKQSAARGGSDPRYNWVIPYLGFEPAVWMLSIKKNVEQDLVDDLFVRIKTSSLYHATNVHIPAKFPASNLLKIPVVLVPDSSDIDPPLCVTDPFGNTTCKPSPLQSKPICIGQYYEVGKSKPQSSFQTDCSGVNYAGIYYRDAWLNQKFHKTSCFAMTGASYNVVGPIWMLYSPPFIAAASLRPDQPATWDVPFFGNCSTL